MRYKIFLDYDNLSFKKIVKDVRKLMRKYSLGCAKIYVSSKNHKPYHYHVYFKRKVNTIDEWRQIVSESNCCPNFKEYAQIFPFMILRIRGTKPHPYLYATVTLKKIVKHRKKGKLKTKQS